MEANIRMDGPESGPRVVEERHDGQRWEAIPMSKDLTNATSP